MSHTGKKDYRFEDFIKDADFRSWVYSPNLKTEHFWKKYLELYPQKGNDVEKAITFLESVQEFYESNTPSEKEVQKRYEAFLAHYETRKPKKVRALQTSKKKIFNYAAAAAIVFLLAFTFIYTSSKKDHYSTAYGEYKKIELPDGSEVTLGANSRLEVGKNWTNTSNREVWLDGEAYFDVRHIEETHAKFTVITDDVDVEVLGTAFSVDNRKADTKVILEKGKIKLDIKSNLNQELYLSPGEKITYTSKSRQVPKKIKARKDETSWKDGVITYTDAPLHVVLSKIQDIYGTQLELKAEDASLENKEVTVSFPITDKEVAITTIETVLGITFLE